ncbi:MAG: TNT domain-containing protein, partial [Clostridia bacterium]|nr:TNT domain-containing protein [Clostridia bacterium]
DNYISPEENFEKYLNQPVEKDAREYAETIKNQIPENSPRQDVKPETEDKIKTPENNESNPNAPPEADYQSKTVSELPSDFEAKDNSTQLRHEQKMDEICKEASENHGGESGNIESKAKYSELSQEEKVTLSNKLSDYYDSIPKGERGNITIPEPEKIKGVNPDGTLENAWKKDTDGALENTRHMEVPQKGDVIDRIGGDNGNYFSPMGEDGKPAPVKERALGIRIPESNITENSAYHAYEIKQDFTRENFNKAIDETYKDPATREAMHDKLDSYYDNAANPESKNHPGESYTDDAKTADGVSTGTIAPMFHDDDGGAKQYITPFSAKEMQEMGMIEEIKKEGD